jgi:protein-S-isoprenylcysteine O-methyltransferase Ste14
MQGYIAIVALAVMIFCVLLRSAQMRKMGIEAFHFGKIDKKDFLIPPFVLLFLYLIIANTFHLPKFGDIITSSSIASWIGVLLCVFAPALFLWGIVSFGKSFRVGIDNEKPGCLVTAGAFSFSRNPLYLAFFMILAGIFLIYPTWVFFVYFIAGLWLIDRQVCLEENSLKIIYGKEYDDYCIKVRRYI